MTAARPNLLLFVPLVALAVLGALLLGYSAFGAQMNQYASDVFFRLRGGEKEGTDQVVIVAIDERAISEFGNLPVSRGVIAQALRNICAGGPKVVGLDLLFSGPTNPEADQALAAGLAACPQTVLAVSLAQEDTATLQAAGWAVPLPDFARPAAGLGHAHVDPDLDGVCRQVLLAKAADQSRYWALALEVFRVFQNQKNVLEPDDRTLVVGNRIIPVPLEAAASPRGSGQQRLLLINYAGGEGTFPQYPLSDVVRGQVPAQAFAGRAVLLGATAPASGDRKFTPFSTLGRDMPGVEIHANALRTLLTGRFLVTLRDSTALGIVLGIAGVLAVVLLLLRGAALAVALVLLAAAVHAVPYLLFRERLTLAPAFSFSLAFWAPLLVGGTVQYLTVWRNYRVADESRQRLRGGLEMVAHEIRTPLSAIQGSGEVISRYPLDEEKRKQLGELVSRESQRVANLLARFLDVERLEAGEMQLKRESVCLLDVAARSIERIQPLANRKNIQVRLTDKAPVESRGDAELLEFALYNLLSNAVKYSPEKSMVAVKVGSKTALGVAFIEVSDQGAGIAKEDQPHIFDRFYRASSAASSGQPGIGLGLSIVREIARHHQGSVMVESAPGHGSRFSLVLPLSEDADGHPPHSQAHA